ncbi:carbohydrate porin [Bradyrhizobium sp. USDA 4353]
MLTRSLVACVVFVCAAAIGVPAVAQTGAAPRGDLQQSAESTSEPKIVRGSRSGSRAQRKDNEINRARTAPLSRATETPRRIDRRTGRLHDRLRAQSAIEEDARRDVFTPYADYLAAKKQLGEAGVTFQLAPTVMAQWGWPAGGAAASQVLLSPNFNWDITDNALLGRSSIQLSYGYNRYFSRQNGATLSAATGVNSFVNEAPTNGYYFYQATWTQEFSGNWAQITVGQFPIFLFDSNAYAGNQQQNFVNYALAQNASAAYITTSLGGYVQLNPTDTVSVVAGIQDANNTTGNHIQTSTVGNGPWTWFAYGQWNPQFASLGSGQYGLLYYNQPAVAAQWQNGVPALAAGQGWSLNAVQNLNPKIGLFARINTASGPTPVIATSVAFGFVYNNPLGLGSRDQLGVGLAWNKTNLSAFAGQNVRESESAVELYYNLVLSKFLQVGPSFQVIINPALHPGRSTAEVLTLRASGLF